MFDKPKETLGFPKAAGINTLGPSWGVSGARTSQAFLTALGMGVGVGQPLLELVLPLRAKIYSGDGEAHAL